jgi:hypothetical protein
LVKGDLRGIPVGIAFVELIFEVCDVVSPKEATVAG